MFKNIVKFSIIKVEMIDMSVQKVKYNNSFVFISDEVNDDETGKIIKKEKQDLEKTIVIEPINEKDILSETSVDVFGGDDE